MSKEHAVLEALRNLARRPATYERRMQEVRYCCKVDKRHMTESEARELIRLLRCSGDSDLEIKRRLIKDGLISETPMGTSGVLRSLKLAKDDGL